VIPRVIPCLLLKDGGLVKTTRFAEPRYVGDPINTVRIFNDKRVDEIVLLDISATPEGRVPDERAIEAIASEAFMPMAYGGGVRDLATARRLIQLGVEKIIVNTVAVEQPDVVSEIVAKLGSSTIVVAIDAARRSDGSYEVMVGGGRRTTGLDPVAHAQVMAERGAGELLVTSIDRDGTMQGYDTELLASVARAVPIPVIGSGGASSLENIAATVAEAGVAAAAAGSLFVFHGRHRAVLVNYPSYERRVEAFTSLAR
jgi:cyclase